MGREKNHAYTEEFRKEAIKRSEKPGVTQAMLLSWELVLSKLLTGKGSLLVSLTSNSTLLMAAMFWFFSVTSIPSLNGTPSITFARSSNPLNLCQRFWRTHPV